MSRPVPPPLVVLCAPRSGSTVFCAMLAQHPGLYAFPELNLFITEKLGDLLSLERPGVSVWEDYLAGLVRAVAELEYGSQDAPALERARGWIAARQDWSGAETFAHLAGRVAPGMAVEKSTRTAASAQSLARLARWQPEARILHLTRRPADAIASQARMTPGGNDAAKTAFFARLWLHIQRTVSHFGAGLPATRFLRVRIEDVWQAPAECLRRVLDWAGLPCPPPTLAAMLRPERWPYAFPVFGPLAGDGDPTFFRSPRLRLPALPSGSDPVENLGLPPDLERDIRRECEGWEFS